MRKTTSNDRSLGMLLQAIHFLAGFVFVFVDTDTFRPELNTFTGDFLFGAPNVFRIYTYIFSFYFLGLGIQFVRGRQAVYWWTANLGIGFYAIFALTRLFVDGRLFKPIESLEIRNVILLGIIIATATNPASWNGWLKPFIKGCITAFLIRVIFHFLGGPKDTLEALGVDAVSFYGTYSIHCGLAVALGIVVAIRFAELGRWWLFLVCAILVLVSLAVLASGFSRLAMLYSIVTPCFGLCLAYWLRKQTRRGLIIMATVFASIIGVLGVVLVGYYGIEAAGDRVYSLTDPKGESAAQTSNLAYLDDWKALSEVLQNHPWGVGYGNSYGVNRYIDSELDSADAEFEIPLHIGWYELSARTGVFGLGVIVGLLWPVLYTLWKLRGKLPKSQAMVAGGLAAFFLFGLLFPFSAPLTSQLKVMATYGIVLGCILQMLVRYGRNIPDKAAAYQKSTANLQLNAIK
jgi:hypothetical protein